MKDNSRPTAPNEPLWTVKDVATYLKCSVSWAQKAAAMGDLPSCRIGRMLRFDPDEIRDFALRGLRRRRSATVRVLKPEADEPSP